MAGSMQNRPITIDPAPESINSQVTLTGESSKTSRSNRARRKALSGDVILVLDSDEEADAVEPKGKVASCKKESEGGSNACKLNIEPDSCSTKGIQLKDVRSLSKSVTNGKTESSATPDSPPVEQSGGEMGDLKHEGNLDPHCEEGDSLIMECCTVSDQEEDPSDCRSVTSDIDEPESQDHGGDSSLSTQASTGNETITSYTVKVGSNNNSLPVNSTLSLTGNHGNKVISVNSHQVSGPVLVSSSPQGKIPTRIPQGYVLSNVPPRAYVLAGSQGMVPGKSLLVGSPTFQSPNPRTVFLVGGNLPATLVGSPQVGTVPFTNSQTLVTGASGCAKNTNSLVLGSAPSQSNVSLPNAGTFAQSQEASTSNPKKKKKKKYFVEREPKPDIDPADVKWNDWTCWMCGYVLPSAKTVMEHFEASHPGDWPFRCKLCGKLFRKQHSFRDHYNVHTGVKPFKCEVCGERFFRMEGRYLHFRHKHNMYRRQIDSRGNIVSNNGPSGPPKKKKKTVVFGDGSIYDTDSHKNTNALKEKPDTGADSEDPEDPEEQQPQPDDAGEKPKAHHPVTPLYYGTHFKCWKCREVCSSEMGLIAHFTKQHEFSGKLPFRCQICKDTCISLMSLQNHIHNSHVGDD